MSNKPLQVFGIKKKLAMASAAEMCSLKNKRHLLLLLSTNHVYLKEQTYSISSPLLNPQALAYFL